MYSRSTSKHVACVAAIVISLLCLLGSSALASTFSVNPIVVNLAKSNTSASVAVTNQSTQKLRLQITGFAWQQDVGGKMQLSNTDDLIFFPQLVTLNPGETRRVRVGTTVRQGPLEKAYRLFLEELPSLEAVTAPHGNTLNIRMKIGIPIFVAAAEPPTISGSVKAATIAGRTLTVTVANIGNTHFSVQNVHVVGSNAAGASMLTQDLSGWYVLAGGTRDFPVKLSDEQCRTLHSVSVTVRTEKSTFAKTLTNLSKQCGAAGSH